MDATGELVGAATSRPTRRRVAAMLGAVVVDWLGIRPLFWGGGSLLFLSGRLGLVLLGSYDVRRAATATDRSDTASPAP